MPKILKEKLGIENENHNTLIQNVKQVKNNRNKTLVLVDKKGKRVYAGDINKAPKKYADLKVKSLNKSIHKKNTLFYALLEDVKQPGITNTIDRKDIKSIKYGNVYIHQLSKNAYVITPNKTFKMESGLSIFKSLEEAKKEYIGDMNIKQRNKQLQAETAKKEAMHIKQEKEQEKRWYNTAIKGYQDKLNNIKIGDMLEKTISLNGKKRTILIHRKSNKMFRIKISRSKWVEYNLTNASKRLYRLLDDRKLDILK